MDNQQIKQNEFQCVHCGGIFEKEWTEEESLKEAEEIFGKPVAEWKDTSVVLCDDCFEVMNPRNNPVRLAEAKKHL